ncbi:MAG: hypothetical protein ABEL51_14035 [Salinibacter sp.]
MAQASLALVKRELENERYALQGLDEATAERKRQALAVVRGELTRREAQLRRFQHPEFGWVIRPVGTDRELSHELDRIADGLEAVIGVWQNDLSEGTQGLQALCTKLHELRDELRGCQGAATDSPALEAELSRLYRTLHQGREVLEPIQARDAMRVSLPS